MIKLAEKINSLFDELKAMPGFIRFDGGKYDAIRVHMQEETFTSIFDDFDFKDRNCDTYPTEISVVIDGVKFFALSEHPATFCEYCGAWITDDNRGTAGRCKSCGERGYDRDMDDSRFDHYEERQIERFRRGVAE